MKLLEEREISVNFENKRVCQALHKLNRKAESFSNVSVEKEKTFIKAFKISHL